MLDTAVIIACDFPDRETTLRFLNKFDPLKPFIKIGMELFYGAGPGFVQELKQLGYAIFLDLKLQDIPNTINRTVKILAKLNVDMLTIHAVGGMQMMSAARQALDAEGSAAILVGVTLLTSISGSALKQELLITEEVSSVVCHYATQAKKCGLQGIVCSPMEASLVKSVCGGDFLCVTPGIRYQSSVGSDQARVNTPAAAKEAGSDFIVVGRAITGAPDPAAEYRGICVEFQKGE
ncbi:MAG: orotidine-5'-phosphate decarboxylase [Oscillospiraceae bacterium]|jgi:orotidine-5'-phosphate decarboxylase|nr:orotidine-5'-phosphate decarboxylase [Oscillospiraceae bacterium]